MDAMTLEQRRRVNELVGYDLNGKDAYNAVIGLLFLDNQQDGKILSPEDKILFHNIFVEFFMTETG